MYRPCLPEWAVPRGRQEEWYRATRFRALRLFMETQGVLHWGEPEVMSMVRVLADRDLAGRNGPTVRAR